MSGFKKAGIIVLTGLLALIGFTVGSIILIPVGMHLHDRWDYFGPFGTGWPALIGWIVSGAGAVVAALIPWLILRSRKTLKEFRPRFVNASCIPTYAKSFFTSSP